VSGWAISTRASAVRARIGPKRQAKTLSCAEAARLVRGVRTVLAQAIRAGGTTLRDYLGADGAGLLPPALVCV